MIASGIASAFSAMFLYWEGRRSYMLSSVISVTFSFSCSIASGGSAELIIGRSPPVGALGSK